MLYFLCRACRAKEEFLTSSAPDSCQDLLAAATDTWNMIKPMQGETPLMPTVGTPAGTGSDPERWVDEYGDFLFKFALARLRDPARAEDAVQETFLAALKSGQSFSGRSTERSWLVGILKNKIYDHFRKSSRETPFTDLEFYSDEEKDRFVPDVLGKSAWNHDLAPQQWPNPGESLDNELFWKTYRDCSNKLPNKVAAAFNLREVDGIESKEVCALLNISESNLWVMLHRARMALRRCLEINWFSKQT
jgi:RNA polymerase sigma-70 factor (ECF subfamily)